MNNRGFSLVEMMIALVVMAILLTVALPNYQQFARESRRADGKAALLGLQMAQEKLRANCRFYAGSVGNTNTCGADAANSTANKTSRARTARLLFRAGVVPIILLPFLPSNSTPFPTGRATGSSYLA